MDRHRENGDRPFPSPFKSGSDSETSLTGLQSETFVPKFLEADPTRKDFPAYEPFQVLVQCANSFLQQHPQLAVVTCESVEFAAHADGQSIGTQETSFKYKGQGNNRMVRGLRLWMQTRNASSSCDQIGYCNFLPLLQQGSIDCERLDRVIGRANAQFQSHPLPGRVITIETQPIVWGDQGVQPDASFWVERGDCDVVFLTLIRVFFIQGPPRREQIGIADFPTQSIPDPSPFLGLCHTIAYEKFPAVLARAQAWLQSAPRSFRITNVQTITAETDVNVGVDTLRMSYKDSVSYNMYTKYLRVAYVIEPSESVASRPVLQLSCKVFGPDVSNVGWFTAGTFEQQNSVRARMDKWAQSTRARILAVESVIIRYDSGGEHKDGYEAMFTWEHATIKSGKRERGMRRTDSRYVVIFRVYTDGIYQ